MTMQSAAGTQSGWVEQKPLVITVGGTAGRYLTVQQRLELERLLGHVANGYLEKRHLAHRMKAVLA